MDRIIALCKRRGFIYPSSEIYGGISGFWDYGPLGVELKNNIKREWWKNMVQKRDDIVGIDASIIMNPRVWQASGHVEAFTDPLVECKVCHKRFRSDNKNEIKKHEKKAHPDQKTSWTEPRNFNLLLKASLGIIEGEQSDTYLRGEITQGAFVNFRNIVDSIRVKIPFGIAQIGKAFRNEITPGNFTYRSREFEQMELEFFIKPEEKEGQKWFDYWKNERMKWYLSLGMNKNKLRFREHLPNERAHYAIDAEDIEYEAPFGWSEFEGIHNRSDWDLSRHKIQYKDPETNQEYVPWVIEASGGVDRSALFFLLDSYREEGGRIYLKIHPKLSAYKVAVFPLVANKSDLVAKAREIHDNVRRHLQTAWDDRGNIGKRYATQDEIGTPFCITIDYQTLENQTVTIRDRDTTKQVREKVDKIKDYLEDKLPNL